MNPEVKKMWIKALRSGEYRQAQGHLGKIAENGEASYCCLGVLCEIAVKEGVEISRSERNLEWNSGDGIIFEGSFDFLPLAVQEWADIDSSGELSDPIRREGEYPEEIEYATTLAELNDEFSFSFNEIADVIEEQF